MATRVKREAIVARDCATLFDLVNDIDAYQDFIPWCSESRIEARDGERVTATLEFTYRGLGVRFTTANRAERPHSIRMDLVSGPFRRLVGLWSFTPLGDAGCKVEFDLEFEFSNALYAATLTPALEYTAGRIVDVFVERASAADD